MDFEGKVSPTTRKGWKRVWFQPHWDYPAGEWVWIRSPSSDETTNEIEQKQ